MHIKMSTFSSYFIQGFHHISSLNTYDHILFVAALFIIYQIADWKKVLWLVTSFTFGHLISVVLTSLNDFTINNHLIEFLLPCIILITAISNIFFRKEKYQYRYPSHNFRYFFGVFFAFIHGMGISNHLKAVLGNSENIMFELFAFNIGVEVCQILLLFAILAASFIFVYFFRVTRREWNLIISGAVGGIALLLVIENSIF